MTKTMTKTMTTNRLLPPLPRAMARTALAALALLVPVSAASPAVSEAEFDATFAPFDTAAPVPSLEGDVVDLATHLPPVEAEPATTSLGSGVASYYAAKFHGRRTASGERFDNRAMTAAHRTLPFGTMVRVTNPHTGASVVVRINDRGPFTRGRTIDLSRAAAEQVGIVQRGHATVELALLDS